MAYGDEASKTAKVEEFFRLANMDAMLRKTLEISTSQMQDGFLQQMMGFKVTPEQQKSLNELQGKLRNILVSTLAWEKLKPAYIKLFADAYSEAELDDLIAFYRSPTGRAMVSKTPALMTKSTEIVQGKMLEAQSQVQQLLRDFMAQHAKPGQQSETQ